MKKCFREPIPELCEAAQNLDMAVAAHLLGNGELAESLLKKADTPIIHAYTESIWGAESPYKIVRDSELAPPYVDPENRAEQRMPSEEEEDTLIRRDGYHCRFCGVPVIPKKVREKLKKLYPSAVKWGRTNLEQHAGLQALWLQYDHVVPHARGGTNDIDNLIITCAPCNYGKASHCLEELGLSDPRDRPPITSDWDGLVRLLN